MSLFLRVTPKFATYDLLLALRFFVNMAPGPQMCGYCTCTPARVPNGQGLFFICAGACPHMSRHYPEPHVFW